jgi:hypothetical protein
LTFKELLAQPVTLKLRDILGSSFELGQRFQTATKVQRFPVRQARTSNIEVVGGIVNVEPESSNEDNDEEGCDPEPFLPPQMMVDSDRVGSVEDSNVGSWDVPISWERASIIECIRTLLLDRTDELDDEGDCITGQSETSDCEPVAMESSFEPSRTLIQESRTTNLSLL